MACGIIYKITSKLNGKPYVGKTTRTLEIRLGEHCRQKNNSLIDRAIQKHGLENFIVEVLEECETLEQLNEREIFWIAELNCKHPNGYNQTDGGDGLTGWTEEMRAKFIAMNTGKTVSDETRAKLSIASKRTAARPGESERRSAWMKNYYAQPGSLEKKSAEQKKRFENPEERKKISLRNKGRKNSPESNARISSGKKQKIAFPVLEAELEKKQITRRGLAKMIGVSHTTVIKKLRGDIALDSATAIKIREVLAIETPLEELFKRAD